MGVQEVGGGGCGAQQAGARNWVQLGILLHCAAGWGAACTLLPGRPAARQPHGCKQAGRQACMSAQPTPRPTSRTPPNKGRRMGRMFLLITARPALRPRTSCGTIQMMGTGVKRTLGSLSASSCLVWHQRAPSRKRPAAGSWVWCAIVCLLPCVRLRCALRTVAAQGRVCSTAPLHLSHTGCRSAARG